MEKAVGRSNAIDFAYQGRRRVAEQDGILSIGGAHAFLRRRIAIVICSAAGGTVNLASAD
jgi:hypothetical protein